MFTRLFGPSKTSTIESQELEIIDLAYKLFKANERASNEEARANRLAGKLLKADLAKRDLSDALLDIVSMETAGCAHVGKKMAARAREVLPMPVEAGRLFTAPANDAAAPQPAA